MYQQFDHEPTFGPLTVISTIHEPTFRPFVGQHFIGNPLRGRADDEPFDFPTQLFATPRYLSYLLNSEP